MSLTDKKCVPCEGGTPPLASEKIVALLLELGGSWQMVNEKKIQKEFVFRDFVSAMAFVDKVADVAESEGHHPDMHIFYNKVLIELSTHAIGGLSENDFIVAAKIEQVR
jgi:4a-hydroxytetrahydrobiopterin dehydratase